MSECMECLKAEEERLKELKQIYAKIKKENQPNDKEIKVFAVVKTPNGFLSYRPKGHEALSRLEIVQYLFLLNGVIYS